MYCAACKEHPFRVQPLITFVLLPSYQLSSAYESVHVRQDEVLEKYKAPYDQGLDRVKFPADITQEALLLAAHTSGRTGDGPLDHYGPCEWTRASDHLMPAAKRGGFG